MSNGTNAELQIALKANADQLLAAINKAAGKIDELGAKIKSLPSGDKQLNKLSRELARTSVTQQNLIKSFDKLGTESEGTAPKIKKTEDATKNARTALTSLSLTLQDLPFGFIGIQNNLPGVIQGFGNLSTKTEGLKGVTAALITQLKGPAGVFLAFSAVTTVVTFLVQKYGSLGGAIDALIGKQNSLTSQISKFNDEYDKSIIKQQLISQVTNDATASQSGQIAVIQNLTKKATDLTLSQEQQKNALEQLQQISGDYYGDLKTGASNIDLIRQATEKYLKVIIAQARIRKYSDEIDALQEQIYESERLQKEQDLLIKSDIKRNNQIKNFVGTSDNISASIVNQINIQDKNRKVIEDLAVKTFNLNNRVQDFKDKIDQETNTLVENTKVKEKGAKATKDFFASYRPSKEYFDFFKDLKNTSIYEDGKKFFNELSNLDLTKGNDSVKQFNEILKDIQDRFPNKFSDIIVSSPQDLIRAFSKLRSTLDQELKLLEQDIIESEINKRLTEQFYSGLEFAKDTFKRIREEARKTQKSILDPIPASTENIIGLGPVSLEKALAPLLDLNKKMMKAREDFLRNFKDTTALLNDIFFSPLEEQFKNLITTGKINLQEFSRIVVENMKALAAKVLATGIITLLGMLITGGLSGTTQLKTGLTGFQLFGKAFASALGFGGTSGANFGGVNPGGLAMRGAVSLSLRGSDLVGAINRTNTNISRIG
jgi:hypothetical protein